MSNRYFTKTGLEVIDGTLAQGKNVNQVTDETDSAFDLVQGEIDTIQTVANDAYKWANNDQGDEPKPIEHPDEYSARANALEAEGHASGTEGVSTRADGVTVIQYTAKDRAQAARDSELEAIASAAAALASETKAEQWATYTGGTVPGEVEYSAKYYAQLCVAYSDSAAASASAASTSEGNALASEQAAALSETNAGNSETAAALSESNAADSEAAAALSESNAATSEANALASEQAAEAAFDDFDTRYLGAKASDPTLDNNGDPLAEGALYFNTTSDEMRVYDGGSWTVAYVPAGDYILKSDIDDTPVDGVTDAPISSNWAYDHENATAPHDGVVVPQDSDTGAASIPVGTEAQRPGTPASGMFRFNTDDQVFEGYDGTDWDTIGGSVQWQSPMVGTADLFINGDFSDTDLSDYINPGAIAVVENGELKVTRDAQWYIAQAVTVEIGRTYVLRGKGRPSPTNDECTFRAGTTISIGQYLNLSATDDTQMTTMQGEFVATSTTCYVTLGAGNAGDKTVYYDDIELYDKAGAYGAEITAEAGKGYPVILGQSILLPATPRNGDVVAVMDHGDNFHLEPCVVDPNGENIDGYGSGDFTLSGRGTCVYFTYIEDKWQITSLTPSSAVLKDSDTGAAQLPAGTAAQRPGTPASGMLRFNDDDDTFEGYDGTEWGAIGGGGGGGGGLAWSGPYPQDVESGTIVANSYYLVTFQITEYTSGSVTPTVGGTSGTARNAVGVWQEVIQATNTNAFAFSESSFVGTYGTATVFEVTDSSGSAYVDVDAEDTNGYSLRWGVTLVLPASPTDNLQVGFKDHDNSFHTVPSYIDPNGNEVEGEGTGLIKLDSKGQAGVLTYIDDRWLYTDSTPFAPVVGKPLMHVQDIQPEDTAGQSLIVGDTTRNLTSVIVNEISGASLVNNTVTLPAGEYWIEAEAAVNCINTAANDGFRNFIEVDGVKVLSSNSSNVSYHNAVDASISGRLVLTEASDITIVTTSKSSVPTAGKPNDITGQPEKYADLRIWQIDRDIQKYTVSDPEKYLKKPLFRAEHITASAPYILPTGTSDIVYNTTPVNEIPGASLSGSLITLPAGEYEIQVVNPRHGTNRGTVWIADSSNNILSPQLGASDGTFYVTFSHRLVLASETTIKVRKNIGATASDLDVLTGTLVEQISIWQNDAVMEDSIISVPNPDKWLKQPMLQVAHIEPSATDGGTSVSGDNTRTLNTVITNEITGASLSSNQVTLPAGEYWCEIDASASGSTDPLQGQLLDASDDSVLLTGIPVRPEAFKNQTVTISGKLTFSTATAVYINTYIGGSGVADTGLGYPAGSGEDNRYVVANFWRLDAVVQQPRIHKQANTAISGAYVTGDIFGGELIYSTASAFNVAPVSCMSDDLTTALFINTQTGVTMTSPAINTIYNVFIVKYTGDTYGIEYDTDIDGANLPGTVVAQRWLGVIWIDSSGDIIKFKQNQDFVRFLSPGDTKIGSGFTSANWTALDISILPTARIREIHFLPVSDTASATTMSWGWSNSENMSDGSSQTATTTNISDGYTTSRFSTNWTIVPLSAPTTLYIREHGSYAGSVSAWGLKLKR